MAYRKFDTGTWEDKRFEKLDPMERYLFIYLWTNSQCNQSGMYEITLRRMAFETKIPSTDLEPLLKGLSHMVQWWSTDEVVFIPNFLKRQCQNKQFAEGALKIVLETWPDKLQVFVNSNETILEKYKITVPKIVEPTLNPPSTSTVTEADTEAVQKKEANASCPESEKSDSSPELYPPENQNHDTALVSGNTPKISKITEIRPVEDEPIQAPIPEPEMLLKPPKNELEPFCEILLSGGKDAHLVTEDDIAEYQEAYPGIDVRQEIRKCQQWNKASPTRRKTKAGIRRHISSWLGRAQDAVKTQPVNGNGGYAKDRTDRNKQACVNFVKGAPDARQPAG